MGNKRPDAAAVVMAWPPPHPDCLGGDEKGGARLIIRARVKIIIRARVGGRVRVGIRASLVCLDDPLTTRIHHGWYETKTMRLVFDTVTPWRIMSHHFSLERHPGTAPQNTTLFDQGP